MKNFFLRLLGISLTPIIFIILVIGLSFKSHEYFDERLEYMKTYAAVKAHIAFKIAFITSRFFRWVVILTVFIMVGRYIESVMESMI